MADTFFVAPDGNNSNPGTENRPWRTIQYGANQLSPGQTLYIREGNYHEDVRIARSGTRENPITIKAFPGDTVVIDGEYTLPAGTPSPWVTSNQLITHVSGDTFRWMPTGAPVYSFVWSRLVSLDGNYITLEDITIRRSRGRGIGSVGAYTGCVVRNVTVHGCRHNINADGRGSSNFLYENCTFFDGTNFAPFSRPAGQLNWGGAVAHGDMRDMTYRGLTIHSIWGEGILTSQSSIVEDCRIYNTYAMPILIEQSANSIVRRNFIYHDWAGHLRNNRASFGIYLSDEPGSGLGVTDTTDNQIYNNIIVNMRNGIRLDSGDRRISGNAIYNNTIVAGRSETIGVFVGTGEYSDNSFFNNLIYANNGGLLHNDRSSMPNGVTFSHNSWSARPAGWAQDRNPNNDVYGDQHLVAPDTLPQAGVAVPTAYRIRDAQSPVIGRGRSEGAPETDFWARARGRVVDMGAHEFASSDIVVPPPVPDFDFEVSGLPSARTVAFYDRSTPVDAVTAWEWRANGQLFSTERNPVETFTLPGSYTVELKVSGPGGVDTLVRTALFVVEFPEIEVNGPVELLVLGTEVGMKIGVS